MSQLDIPQAHLLQRTEAFHNLALLVFRKEFDGLVHRHFQYVVDALSLELHFQGICLETLAVARFTFQYQVGHELHFHRNGTFALTFFATAPFGVEREVACGVSQLLGKRLFGIELADFIVSFHVSHRIASGGLADRVLIHKLDVLHHADIAFQRQVFTRSFAAFAVFPFQGFVEYIPYKGTLSRTTHAGDYRHHIQWETYIDALQIIFPGSFHFDVIVPRAVGKRRFDDFFTQQIAHGMAVATRLEILHVTLVDDFTSQSSGIRTDVDDVVGCTDDFLVVLYHHHGITQLLQLAEHLDEAVGIPAMQTDTRFVEDVERTH